MPAKNEVAIATLRRRLGIDYEQAELGKGPKFPRCKVRLDGLKVSSSQFPTDSIKAISGFSCVKSHFIRLRNPEATPLYRRVAEFTSSTSICKLYVLTEPQLKHLPNCRISLIGRDSSGLKPDDVLSVLELLPDAKVEMLELAWDFRRASGVDGDYIRRHGVFGKSRQRLVGEVRCWDCWGSRQGPKFVRSYLKLSIRSHRLELQLNRSFLRNHKTRDIFHFHRLRTIIPGRQILFAEIDETKLISWLRNKRYSGAAIIRILEHLRDFDGNLLAQCEAVKRRVGLKNISRVLTPLPTNGMIESALGKWLKSWPSAPNRIGGTR